MTTGAVEVAIAWLALKLAPDASRGLWVGACLATVAVALVTAAVLAARRTRLAARR